jgi:hypothetical protein
VFAVAVGEEAVDAGGALLDWSESLFGDVEVFAGVEDLLGRLSPFAGPRPGGVSGVGAGAERGLLSRVELSRPVFRGDRVDWFPTFIDQAASGT